MEPVPPWQMEGEIIGACNCAWGCPCNFDAPPTYGHCDGFYTLVIRKGSYGDLDLSGVIFLFGGHSPGPVHEGNGDDQLIVDERATLDQRAAVERLWRGGGVGSPFDEFASVTPTRLGPYTARFDVTLDGIRSKVKVSGPSTFDLQLSPIVNPVTGDEEEIYLDKPSGFTSLRSTMGMSSVGVFASEPFSVDISGRYAEHSEFEYSGP